MFIASQVQSEIDRFYGAGSRRPTQGIPKVVDVGLTCLVVLSVAAYADSVSCMASHLDSAWVALVLSALPLLVVPLGVLADSVQGRRGTACCTIAGIACLAMLAVLSFLSFVLATMFLELSVVLLAAQWARVFESDLSGRKIASIMVPALLTGSLIVFFAATGEEVLQAPLLGVAKCTIGITSAACLAVARAKVFQTDSRPISRDESQIASSDSSSWKRFACIFSWGFSAGILVVSLLLFDEARLNASQWLGESMVVGVWAIVLLRHFADDTRVVPRFSGAVIICCMMLGILLPEQYRVIGIVLGLATGFALFVCLVEALIERVKVDGVSALWLIGRQLGFFFSGVLAAVIVALLLSSSHYDPYSSAVVCVVGVIVSAFAQILVGDTEYPADSPSGGGSIPSARSRRRLKNLLPSSARRANVTSRAFRQGCHSRMS